MGLDDDLSRKRLDLSADDRAPPLFIGEHTEWYHGSPLRLDDLKAGSTVTPIPSYAKAMSHKPSTLAVNVHVNTETGERRVIFSQNGDQDGHLYKVLVADPAKDLQQHPGSKGAPGEEVLTTRDLPLDYLEELPVRSEYEFVQAIADTRQYNEER